MISKSALSNLCPVILLMFFYSSCRQPVYRLSFSQNFNTSVLKVWEQQTKTSVKKKNDAKLISTFDLEKKDGITVFDRESFVKYVSSIGNLHNYTFDSLSVVEFNTSGEENGYTKFLLAYCGQKVEVIKFDRIVGVWKLSLRFEKSKDETHDLIKKVSNQKDEKPYWGQYLADVLVISKFIGNNNCEVELYGSLGKTQYDALMQLWKWEKQLD